MFIPTKRQAGQGADHIPRKFQILTVLYEQRVASGNANDERAGLTLGEIAKRIGLSRSPHLRRLLDTLYHEGAVTYRIIPYRKNVSKIVWIISARANWLEPYAPLFDAYLDEPSTPV